MEKKDFGYYQKIELKEILRERMKPFIEIGERKMKDRFPAEDPAKHTEMFFMLFISVFSEFTDITLEMFMNLDPDEIKLILVKWKVENMIRATQFKREASL